MAALQEEISAAAEEPTALAASPPAEPAPPILEEAGAAPMATDEEEGNGASSVSSDEGEEEDPSVVPSEYKSLSPLDWKPAHVSEWVGDFGEIFSEYRHVFTEHRVSGDVLLGLSEHNLEEIGVENLRVRRELGVCIRRVSTQTLGVALKGTVERRATLNTFCCDSLTLAAEGRIRVWHVRIQHF